jgi:hypothetical protein
MPSLIIQWGHAQNAQLEQFLFEEAGRLEQTTALNAQAREFLKEQRILEPAEFRIARIIGEERARAREHIFMRVAAQIPSSLGGYGTHPLRAVGRGLQIFRANECIDGLGRNSALSVFVKSPEITHNVIIIDVENWLEGSGKSPAEQALKVELRASLAKGQRSETLQKMTPAHGTEREKTS